MSLPELCVKRPVFATVISVAIVIVGLFVLNRLPIRALPAVEATSVTVNTRYTGASPQVVETEITEIIESAVSGVSGVDTIESQSLRGNSRTTIEFTPLTNVDEAVNDVRDAVSGVANRLPDDADQPVISKNNSDADPVMRVSVSSDRMSAPEITDYVERFIADRLTVIDGIAQVEQVGGRRRAIRVWLNRWEMAARKVTVDDIETALSRNSLELPAGELISGGREYFVRADARLSTPDEFAKILVKQAGGFQVRLRDVATVAYGVEDDQTAVRTNGKMSVALNILRQSQANTVAISKHVHEVINELRPNLPEGMDVSIRTDDAVFINAAIKEVAVTLLIAVVIVIAVIFLFVGSIRATLVPAVTIPVTIIGTFFGLYLLDYSINILTLLALVLAIGIIVDDAIVIFENAQRRFRDGEDRTTASILGSNQMMFAVIATSVTLIAVFVPLTLIEGTVGLLFVEFGVVLAIAVAVSTFIALSLCPMLTSRVLEKRKQKTALSNTVDRLFAATEARYTSALQKVVARPWQSVFASLIVGVAAIGFYSLLPSELTPREDRGVFFVSLTAPQGASFNYTNEETLSVEKALHPVLESKDALSIMAIVGLGGSPNRAFVVVNLADWDDRSRSAAQIADAQIPPLSRIVGVRAFPTIPAGLGLRGSRTPLQIIISGYEHQQVKAWTDELMLRLEENPKLRNIESNFEENQPEVNVRVRRLRAEDLGISIETIGRTIQTMLASRTATTYIDRGREYDVIVQAAEEDRESERDLRTIYVRSENSDELVPLDAVVALNDRAAAANLRRHNRLPSITVSAALVDGYELGTAIADVQALVAETLPAEARLSFGGLSKEYLESSSGIHLSLLLAIAIIYLVLAAQFESFFQPFAIMLTVPLATVGALITLWATGTTLNIYSQVGLVLLIGLMTKNGILIVDFANQLYAQGQTRAEAALNAARGRLRPIVMTLLSTILGAVPLILASGAGAESRVSIGLVIIGGLALSAIFTVLLTPAMYVAVNSGFGEAAAQPVKSKPARKRATLKR
ncbi:MAG: efflux RND transporter permease subunit [Hyphomicrobiaceae bacterium]|nr:efflux RND transporter permease subunit [Hyphomicrobiaceae bacterium]